MYPNLEAEMARKNINQKTLAEKIHRTPTTLSLKLNGKAILTLPECIEIKKAIGSEFPIEYLFSSEIDVSPFLANAK